MSRPVLGLGVVLILLGLWVAVVPDQVLSIVDWESRQGLYLAAWMRILIGLLLVLSASSTRYPKGLRIFGALVLVAGLCILFLPIAFWAGLINGLLLTNVALFRVGGGFVLLLFGAFLVHAARPAQSGE